MADSTGSAEILPLICVFVALGLFIFSFWKNGSKKKRLPPGPRSWPLVGFIEFILAERPTVLLTKVKEKYGNVFGFRVGSRYCVTLSDFSSVKDGFCKKSIQSRPPRYLRTSTEFKNFSEMGKTEWEIHRQFFSNCLRNLGVGRNKFEEVVLDELSRVIPKMESQVGKAKCNIREVIHGSINNTIFQLMCSRWFDDDHPVMKSFMAFLELIAESFTNNIAFVYFPWLDTVLNKTNSHYKKIAKSCSEIADFVRSEIESREKTHNENNSHDYIDLYLTEMKTGKYSLDFFAKEHLVTNCLLVMMAGTDTTRNTLEWLLLAMADYPEIQDKVAKEILSVLGPEKIPLLADKVNLPYTEAAILESERWKTLVPLNCLRWTTEDTEIQGFTIPKDTVIINNLHNCHMDPAYWKNPEEYMPERFLSKDKSRVVIPEYFMPFSIGKRNCPGDKVAATEIFLYFTRIIQKFKILPPEGGVSFEYLERINRQAVRPVVKVESR